MFQLQDRYFPLYSTTLRELIYALNYLRSDIETEIDLIDIFLSHFLPEIYENLMLNVNERKNQIESIKFMLMMC